jgi:hypothetical protein
MTGDGYQSETAAAFAGRQALADFLSDLLKEESQKKRPQPGDAGAVSVGGTMPGAARHDFDVGLRSADPH